MKIFCFGDSNTYGYDPRAYSGGRYSVDCRWVDLLAKKSGWAVVNGGENGREVPRRKGEIDHFLQLLSDCPSLDLLLLMLGGNDLLQGRSVAEVSARMESFLSQIPFNKQQLVLIGPPPMKLGDWVTEKRLLVDSIHLISAYQEVSTKLGTGFIDTRKWNIDLSFDGVHFSENGHRSFAEFLWETLQ